METTEINIADYITDKVYTNDDVTVFYDLPLNPYTDIYAWMHGSDTSSYFGYSSNILFQQKTSTSSTEIETDLGNFFYTPKVEWIEVNMRSILSWARDDFSILLIDNIYFGKVTYDKQLLNKFSGTITYNNTQYDYIGNPSLNPFNGNSYFDNGLDFVIMQSSTMLSSGRCMICFSPLLLNTDVNFIFTKMETINETTTQFDYLQAFSYPLGIPGGKYAVIDVSDIRTGSNFSLTFDYKFNVSYSGPVGDTTLNYYAYFLDEYNTQVGISKGSMSLDGSSTPGEYEENAGDKKYSVTFTVPDGARYFYVKMETGQLDISKCTRYSLSFTELTMSCALSAVEENSKLMQEITGKLDEIQEEEKKQTGWLASIWEAISGLPKKIVDGIKDALIGLFVPSEADMTAMKDKWEQLLSDRFGAVYESADIISDWAGAFTYTSTKTTVTFPTVSLNLAGTTFVFGGWEVDVVPDQFEGIIDTLKLIVNIACTYLFVNGMKKRLEGVLS